MACACSVFSLAMMVKVLISYRLFCVRSFSESAKSSATASAEAPESEPLGEREDMTSADRAREHVTERANAFYGLRANTEQ